MRFLALFASLVALALTAVQASAIATLAATGSITCRPALGHFCRNIHIGCSGRSDIATDTFILTVRGDRASMAPASTRSPPRSGVLEWADDDAIVWLRPAPDYIRISADGTYSFRLYSGESAYMAYGTCR